MRALDGRRVLVVLVLMVLTIGAPAGAATPSLPGAPSPALPEPLTREAVRELVARLSDQEVRALLLAQLDRAAAPAAGTAGEAMPMMGRMEGETQRARARLRELLAAVPELAGVLPFALAALTESRSPSHLGLVALALAAMLAIGWGAEWLFLRAVGDVRRRLAETPCAGVGAQAGRLALRLLLEVLRLVVFAAAAFAAFLAFYQGHAPSRWLVTVALGATLLTRLVGLAADFLLAPDASALRLLPFEDGAARRLRAAALRLAAVYAFGTGAVTLLRLLGLGQDVATLLALLVGFGVTAVLLAAIWQNRAPVAALVRGGDDGGAVRRLAAEVWPVLATLFVLIVLAAWTGELLSGRQVMARTAATGSLLLVLLAPLADIALCRLVGAMAGPRAEGAGAAAPGGASYGPVLRRGVHIVVTVAALLLLGRLWGLDVFSLAERGIGERLARALIDVAVTLLLAYLAWELVKAAIDRRLAREAQAGAPDVEAEGGGEGSRLGTLLPLVRMFLFLGICTMAVMIVLAALGVNIGPLLAGAGVVGLAVGFGAQTLVRDIVSGMFFLLDDAFRLGEYVDVGSVKGTVEKISIRSMQIRHHRGALHTIPFGEITRLTNESRDWLIMKLEFRLTYDTDLAKVKKILKRIGQELQEDPELGPALLQPLKSQGVAATEDSALVVQAKFMARPGSQAFLIRREAYNRVLKAFAENGIKFAHRQVTVFAAPAGAGASGPPDAAAAAAAADSDAAAKTAPA